MKKRLILLLLLLFALFAVVYLIPGILNGRLLPSQTEDSSGTAWLETETLEEKPFPYESIGTEPETDTEETEPEETRPSETRPDPGEPVDREKTAADIMIASDVHYMSQELMDYGGAFNDLIDNGDGKVILYMPQIWQAFAQEVIAARPDVLILSGDLTLNGERKNHEELAARLAEIEAAGVPVLVIPGNHDINNSNAAAYFGETKSPVETVNPEEFWQIYRAFGYDEAVSYAPDSMSYLYILNDTTWLIMLDTCIYEPKNEVDGEIREGTLEWMEQCLRSAYSQGITVIPIGHHNLQELSRVYVKECVLRNHEEVMEVLERYLTPAYVSGHLHVQRVLKHTNGPGMPDDMYGIWEIVSNSLIIPPCQYGNLKLNTDGSLSYHTRNVDVSGWAAKNGVENQDLLDFSAFSDAYLRLVIKNQTYKMIEDVRLPDHLRELMADFYTDLYQDYYAGRQINYSEKKKELGYTLWVEHMDPSIQFRQLDGMMKDSMAVNSNAEIPNPVRQKRE